MSTGNVNTAPSPYHPGRVSGFRYALELPVPVTEARPRMAAAVGLRGPVGFTQVSGFRFVLELPDRSPADPVMFNTALPPEMWRPGNTFMAAYELRQFRIVEIGELPELPHEKPGGLAAQPGPAWARP